MKGKSRLVIVKTKEEISSLISYCKQTRYCSLDFETTSEKFYDPNEYPTVLGISFQIGSAWVIPLGHYESPFKNSYRDIMRLISKEVLENPHITKWAFNAKFEHKWCLAYGANMKGRVFDAMLAKYLLREERPNDLKSIVREILPDFADYEDEVDTLKKKHGGWAKIPLEPLAKYNGLDCDLTLRLGVFFEQRLIKAGFYPLFRNLLMMGHRVLTHSEYEGMLTDRKYLEGLVDSYDKKITDLTFKLKNHPRVKKFEKFALEEHKMKLINQVKDEINKLKKQGKKDSDKVIVNRIEKISRYIAGELTTKKEVFGGVNFNSSRQMGQLLFESPGGFKFKSISKTDSGADSTAEDVLVELQKKDKSGFIELLLKNRELSKLYSTYILGMHNKLSINDRIHGSFLLHGTVTGRLSSREPNLQNIPRDTTSSDIKKMFISPKGYLLLEIDYSQAELRVVAEMANETEMIDIFKREYNIHVATACKANKCMDRYDEVRKILKDPNHKDWLFWEKQKKRAKTLNFGILYGQTEKALSESLECTPEEARQFMNDWFKAFPRIKKWIKKQERFVCEHGYVKSMWGRKRRLPDAFSDVKHEYLKALRDCVNAPIQSTASDYTLFSSIVIMEEKKRGNLPIDMPQIYTVHDSIGFYIRPHDIHTTVPKLIDICNNPETREWFGFEMKKVKMKVSPEIGRSWGELGDYNPNEDYTKWVNNHTILLKN